MNANQPPGATSGETAPKRDAILEAALDLFSERGFYGTAVPLIAERARVGAGTLYRYFDSKEALVNALYRHWKARLARAVTDSLPADAPPQQQFRELCRRFTRFGLTYPRALAFLELHYHGPYLDAQSRAVDDRLIAPLVGLLEAAQRQMMVKPIAARMVLSMIYGAYVGVLRSSWAGNYEITTADLETIEQCMWEAIRS